MDYQSARNLRANRNRVLITDRTRLSFHLAMARMRAANKQEACGASKDGHSFVFGFPRCMKCGAVNPAALVLPDPTESEAA